MAILEAVLSCEYAGQLSVNRWHYVSSGDSGATTHSFGLMSAMGFLPPTSTPWQFTASTIARNIQQLFHTSVVFKSFYVRDLYTPTDFIETPYNNATVGMISGTGTSPALAYGLTSNRVRTDIARGSKRFVGVSEDALGNGGLVSGDPLSWLQAVADSMSATLSYTTGGASLSFNPAVLGFLEYTTPRGNRAYRKYSTAAVQLTHAALNPTYVAMPYVRTQTSRQYSRGA
jgi:hypothetical protein